ncbi:GDSL-type esterase/lipase family protein [Novosphingobium terrae]|uniref:GDSL-type esterase/lipase family protein n=1 Tax=Novosphingobium terrae TaxID=2726189 RepID=UPI00197E6928|nr:GDSL-type esterase/lipase family protein [Novosphingobium terrae]
MLASIPASRKSRLSVALLALCACTPVTLSASTRLDPVHIVLTGDSTTALHTGWGGAFCTGHVQPAATCIDLGQGGRSTKTYREDGSWAKAMAALAQPGFARTYVFIDFGHNDKNSNPAIGTTLATEFPANLSRMIAEVRAKGGIPVLVTPMAARHFQQGKLDDTLIPWADQVRAVAQREQVPVVDLNAESGKLFQSMGATGAMGFEQMQPTPAEMQAAASGTTLAIRVPASTPVSAAVPANDPRRGYHADYTHLNDKGAQAISAIVARLMGKAVPDLQPYLLP